MSAMKNYIEENNINVLESEVDYETYNETPAESISWLLFAGQLSYLFGAKVEVRDVVRTSEGETIHFTAPITDSEPSLKMYVMGFQGGKLRGMATASEIQNAIDYLVFMDEKEF